MTRHQLEAFYLERESNFRKTASALTKKINLISNARLLIALIFLILIYFAFSNYILFYLTPLVAVVFVILVRNHATLFDQRTHIQNLASINKAEHEVLNGNVNGFDTGSQFIDPHHPYSHDLDLFGEYSVFQFLNRCNTISGKQKLAAHLNANLSSSTDVNLRQQAIRELSEKTDFRQHYQASGMEIDELQSDRAQLLHWTSLPAFVYGKSSYKILLMVVPALTVLSVAGTFFFDAFRPIAVLLAAFQWAFLGFHIKRVNEFHEYISRKKSTLEKYAKLLHFLTNEKFESTELNACRAQAADADVKVNTLASLVRALDARLNSMTSLVMNSLFMYDLQCIYRLEKWKEENAKNLESWLMVAAEIEVLNSFGTFAFNHSNFFYPTITNEFAIRGSEMGHPLIDPSECVVNDVLIGNGPSVLIVTGANMAGKSTFLRTLGTNIIFALNGLPVCAKEFACPILQLRTGMRTADSLKDHQSYFYAELDRLKGIMDELRNDVPLLILLDEILKGTNSTDKQAGSISLVKQLLPHPCLAIIATHDLALGDLESQYPGKVKNYHFEANIENDQLCFDYKLKPGIAQKMNATFLMKKMGIIPA